MVWLPHAVAEGEKRSLDRCTAPLLPLCLCSEPEPSPGWFPTHLFKPLMRSFNRDHYVADEGNIVFYQQDPDLANPKELLKKI